MEIAVEVHPGFLQIRPSVCDSTFYHRGVSAYDCFPAVYENPSGYRNTFETPTDFLRQYLGRREGEVLIFELQTEPQLLHTEPVGEDYQIRTYDRWGPLWYHRRGAEWYACSAMS